MAESFDDFLMPVVRKHYKNIIGNYGDYFLEEEWDNLIILDACRYDTFKKYNDISEDLEFRYSRGGLVNSLKKTLKKNTILI
ncbi:MAG: hypothetical protein ACOC56_06340 [Atribacterota bacterium]